MDRTEDGERGSGGGTRGVGVLLRNFVWDGMCIALSDKGAGAGIVGIWANPLVRCLGQIIELGGAANEIAQYIANQCLPHHDTCR